MRGTLIDPTKNEHDAFDYGDRPSKSQRIVLVLGRVDQGAAHGKWGRVWLDWSGDL